MTCLPVNLLDPHGRAIATAQVTEEGGRFWGRIDFGPMPTSLRKVFEEFEEIVNGQVLSLLDEIEAEVAALSLRAVFGDGREVLIEALHIYPATGDISFRVKEKALTNHRPAWPRAAAGGLAAKQHRETHRWPTTC